MSDSALNEAYKTEACSGCNVTLRFPDRSDIKVTCPKCGTSNVKNPTKKWRFCRHCNVHVTPKKHYLEAAGTLVFGVLVSAVAPPAGSQGVNKAIRTLGEQYCPKCDRKL